MILLLDTTEKNAIFFALADSIEKDFLASRTFRSIKGRVDVLCSLEKFLLSRRCTLKQLKGIIVVSGPGGFAAIRSGVAIANALSYALALPVVGVQKKHKNRNSCTYRPLVNSYWH